MLIRSTCKVDTGFHFLTLGELCFYIIEGNNECHLFDTGTSGHIPLLLKRFEELSILPEKLTHIHFTHLHPERITGIPTLKQSCPNAQIFAPQVMESKLQDEQFLASLFQSDHEISSLFGKQIAQSRISQDDFNASFKEINYFPDFHTFHVGTDFSIHPISFAGHTAESYAYHIPEIGVLIVDEGFGYHRGSLPAAPGADFSLSATADSLRKAKNLEFQTIGMPLAGLLTGDLVQKHLEDTLDATTQILTEYQNAEKAGIPQNEVKESLREALFLSPYRDPVYQFALDRTYESVWAQLTS